MVCIVTVYDPTDVTVAVSGSHPDGVSCMRARTALLIPLLAALLSSQSTAAQSAGGDGTTIFEGANAPRFMVYEALLRTLSYWDESRGRDTAELWVRSQLNTAPELSAGGGLYLLADDHPDFMDEDEAKPIINAMFQHAETVLNTDDITKEYLCPTNAERPMGARAISMFKVETAAIDARRQNSLSSLLSIAGQDSPRIIRWIDRSSTGYKTVRHSPESYFEQTGRDVDQFVYDLCVRVEQRLSGEQ